MRVAVLPMDAQGHINACVGLANILRDAGHECVFIVENVFSHLIVSHKFKVETFSRKSEQFTDPQRRWAEFMAKHCGYFAKPPIEQAKGFTKYAMQSFVDYVMEVNDDIEKLIAAVKPDLLVCDYYLELPAVILSKKPWVSLISANHLGIYREQGGPVSSSGFGKDTDPKEMQELMETRKIYCKDAKEMFDKYLVSKGIEPPKNGFLTPSSYLNVYSYPKELEYTEYGPIPDKYFRIDCIVRPTEEEPLKIDEDFLKSGEKLVYFSLGSMGSADVDLMHKLLNIFGKSKHKFIVSMGAFHDKIQLKENMRGEKYINQMRVLHLVDLVITHGGNNTFLESMYFGKPVIVMPLFGDQHDNGRRVVDKKIGACFYPYQVKEEQLLQAIDSILESKEINDRVKAISQQMRTSKSSQQFVKLVENIVQQNTNQ